MSIKNATSKNNRKRRPRTKAARSAPARARDADRTHHGHLTSISIEGFRGISKLKVKGLAPLTVFTGDNGSGKSTLLEAAFAIYGRTTPMWVVGLQAKRGMATFSPEKGPTLLGWFYGPSEFGKAVISGSTVKGTKLTLEMRRGGDRQQSVIIGHEPQLGERGAFNLPQVDLANPERAQPLEFHARGDGATEFEGRLIWSVTAPNALKLEAPGAYPAYPRALLQHPSGAMFAPDDKNRFGDIREAGRDERLLELLQAIDPRITYVEYLQATDKEYFRATLTDKRTIPLGMLGGGIVNVFRFGVNLAAVEDGFLAIDEVENGIYYRRLLDVFRALIQARKHFGTQLMLATHSHEALSAIVDAASEHDPDAFAVVHLRRDADDIVQATTIAGPDAKSSLEHGYDLR